MESDFWKKNSDSIGVLNDALDKQAIVDSVLNGQGCTAYSPIQKNPLGTNSEADIYAYDLERFAEEMQALGWEKGEDGIYVRNGERFHFTIQTRDYEEERIDIANLMSAMLKQAGVEMEVVLVAKFDWNAGYDGFLAGFARGIAHRGKCQLGDRTILDAVDAGARKAQEACAEGADMGAMLRRAAEGAKEGVKATEDMLPKYGKAAVFSAKAKGVPDQGAVAGQYFLEGLGRYFL